MRLNENILWLHELRLADLARVGGKNSSLGEMIGHLANLGVSVPGGYATTAEAFKAFIAHNDLSKRIFDKLATLDVEDVPALTAAGAEIRGWVIDAPLQPDLDADIRTAYVQLCAENGGGDVAVAVRSSATAEDLPDASFAGQQETFLNVTGEDDVVRKVKEVFASLYNDRAIAYRVHHGFKHEDVFLSAGVQLMVRSGVGASGVLFTLDTESGFRDVVFVTSSFGLGEMVVQGAVNPDEFYVYKPTLQAGKPARYFMLHKPAGVVSATVHDEHRTVLDLLDEPDKHELHIGGRLDLNTSGLLLITNDGLWSRRLTEPRSELGKVYQVETEQAIDPACVAAFARGLYFSFENLTTRPATLEILAPRRARLTLFEGRYHQVKRMFGHFDNKVMRLHREPGRAGQTEVISRVGAGASGAAGRRTPALEMPAFARLSSAKPAF